MGLPPARAAAGGVASNSEQKMGLPPARARARGVVGKLGERRRLSHFFAGVAHRTEKSGNSSRRGWIGVYPFMPMSAVDMFSRVFLYWAAGNSPIFSGSTTQGGQYMAYRRFHVFQKGFIAEGTAGKGMCAYLANCFIRAYYNVKGLAPS
ncbi:MAG: hypothetical protein BWX80_03689 [Candidatus Hydrogenedentes bacterium ADurb.Bin101]|nr:MAG: hypothetical protein BWX80_03689 [Candidatus Hydrogenedentes bacterium ADurb.Bin101]